MFHKLRFPSSTPKLKLLGKAFEVCVYTKKKIVIKIDWMFATYRQHFVKNPLNYDVDTHIEHWTLRIYMSQLAFQHSAEADINISFIFL